MGERKELLNNLDTKYYLSEDLPEQGKFVAAAPAILVGMLEAILEGCVPCSFCFALLCFVLLCFALLCFALAGLGLVGFGF